MVSIIFTDYATKTAYVMHPSGVTRTRVTGVNFSEIFSRERKFSSSQQGVEVIRVQLIEVLLYCAMEPIHLSQIHP